MPKLPHIPKPKNPVQKREDGTVAFGGLSAPEWGKACTGLAFVWTVVAGFTAVMFIAAQAIRGGMDSVLDRPGDAKE